MRVGFSLISSSFFCTAPNVGGVAGDTIREIYGRLGLSYGFFDNMPDTIHNRTTDGAFALSRESTSAAGGNNVYKHTEADMLASRVVPTGNVNAPRRFGVLPCVYLGEPR